MAVSPFSFGMSHFNTKRGGVQAPPRLSSSFVFLPGGDAAPDVALSLVLLQDLFYLEVERPVEGRQALG